MYTCDGYVISYENVCKYEAKINEYADRSREECR